jgi:hypothetical protein
MTCFGSVGYRFKYKTQNEGERMARSISSVEVRVAFGHVDVFEHAKVTKSRMRCRTACEKRRSLNGARAG